MNKLKDFFRYLRAVFAPGDIAWRSASIAIVAIWIAFLILLSINMVFADFTIWKALGFLIAVISLLLIGAGGYLAIIILAAPHKRFVQALIIPSPLLFFVMIEFGWKAGVILGVAGLIALALIIGSATSLMQAEFRISERKATMAALTVGSVTLVVIIYLIVFQHEQSNPALAEYSLPDQTLDLSNPALHGDLPVLFTTYGSGEDQHRIEFGDDVGVRSESVDGSKLIDNWEGSAGGWGRSGYWGFGPDELPVQGRIWYPGGDGRYPLVLMVHGNHVMEDFSDPGYEYIGRLLASRGYIFVSVDENFLNLSVADSINPIERGLEEENDARGWLLLEHLKQWREWNQTIGHTFYGKVNLEEISLIGHSRGGEAVAVASYFNDLAYYPDDASLAFDYRFNLEGIVAIAPVDGQYKPRDNGTAVRNTSYFVIHGSMDADVISFMGLTQYNRVKLLSPDQFKASLYVYGANHGQFNSSWGDQDTPFGWSLRKSEIMPAESQQQIAEVYFSAFLDVVHKGREEYLPIFKSAQFAAGWLPNTYYINNFEDTNNLWLLNFEEDGDPATATSESAHITTNNLSKWYESWIKLKWRPLETHAVGMAWDERFTEDKASFAIQFSEPTNLADFKSLVFSVSQGTGSTLPKNYESKEDKHQDEDDEDNKDKPTPLDWSIVIIDDGGIRSHTLLSLAEPLYPQVKADTLRVQFGYTTPRSEAVLKYYSFPIEEFKDDAESFNVGRVKEIRFEFDQSARGHIIVDDVGLSRDD